MKLSHASTLTIALLIAGCASFQPSLPEGYAGPKASIRDTAKIHSSSKADLFYLKTVDERQLRDSHLVTIQANQGRGASLTPKMQTHDVPAKPTKFSVVGITHYGAPILAMTNPVYEAKGVVEFAPEDKKTYVVRGSLSAEVSTVWIEEDGTGRVVGNKVEVRAKK